MLTQHEKILKTMRTDPDRWWLPVDFMQSHLGELFVGYEASARLSELAKMGEVDSKRAGKYMARRIKQQAPPPPPPAPAPEVRTEQEQQSLIDVPVTPPRRMMI